ncbi:M16 family metallopeptidase [Salsipaludibacter albus]|uniref:M16 family metallopeptidase n=1 Tax=Salsipaludibacter albus TaxID=2849650 RepID=UPI001EE450B3|nr:pitrilysin family protein [Salsipaludibacter albus]MBY5160951.1 insulinase family protein [Salsipaludibacter albus]
MPATPVTTTLDNGLRVVVAPDHLVPAVAVELWYDVGSRHEESGRTGFAHLFEHLMFQGSRNVDATGHFAAIQSVGGTLNGTTSFDRTNYYETVPTRAFDLALWLEADRMGTLLDALDQANLDNQRDVVKNERRQRYDNQPYGTAWEELFVILFPEGHPYHHLPIGSMADLDAADLDDVHRFFLAHYSPHNAVLSIAGDVAVDAATEAAGRWFGGITGNPRPPAAPDGAIGPRDGTEVRHSDEAVPAATRYVTWRVPPDGDPVHDAVVVAFEVLTGGGASRLVRRAVREEELAETVSGGTFEMVGGVDVATVVARARSGSDLDDLAAVMEEEVALLAEDEPTEDELVRAVERLRRDRLDTRATLLGRADDHARGVALFGDATWGDRADDRLAAVTPAAVRDAAATWLRPDARAILDYRNVA